MLCILTLVLLRWAAGGFSWYHFVVIGETHVQSKTLADQLTNPSEFGYDGQFFYQYALTPFSTDTTGQEIRVDSPPYRQQRIVYPVLAWFVAGGQAGGVPFTLVLVNVLAFCGLMAWMWRWQRLESWPPWIVVLPLLVPGLWMSLARDLSELWEAFFVLAAMFAALRRNLWALAIWTLLATFSRETSAFFTAPLLVAALWQQYRIQRFRAAVWLPLLLAPYAIFYLYRKGLRSIYEGLPAGGGLENFGFPLVGWWQGLQAHFGDLSNATAWMEAGFWTMYMGWLFLLAFALLVRYRELFVQSRPEIRTFWIACMVWLAVAACFSHKIYEDDWSFVRVFSSFQLVALVLLFGVSRKIPRYLLWIGALVGCATFVRLILRA
ncbi:MAG: hypothetical protein F6K11_01830 [Leptolyngbya sp. SIO3F4]|nr:hypothetical protein [Leptolyngbya sp. SIO3F4]